MRMCEELAVVRECLPRTARELQHEIPRIRSRDGTTTVRSVIESLGTEDAYKRSREQLGDLIVWLDRVGVWRRNTGAQTLDFIEGNVSPGATYYIGVLQGLR